MGQLEKPFSALKVKWSLDGLLLDTGVITRVVIGTLFDDTGLAALYY